MGATEHGACGVGIQPSSRSSVPSTSQPLDPPARAFLAVPTRIDALCGENVAAIAACGFHSMALAGDGTVFTWGQGQFGRLGHGNENVAWTPTRVSPALLRDVVAISAGESGRHTA